MNRMESILITNNSKVYDKFNETLEIVYLNDYSYLDILYL